MDLHPSSPPPLPPTHCRPPYLQPYNPVPSSSPIPRLAATIANLLIFSYLSSNSPSSPYPLLPPPTFSFFFSTHFLLLSPTYCHCQRTPSPLLTSCSLNKTPPLSPSSFLLPHPATYLHCYGPRPRPFLLPALLPSPLPIVADLLLHPPPPTHVALFLPAPLAPFFFLYPATHHYCCKTPPSLSPLTPIGPTPLLSPAPSSHPSLTPSSPTCPPSPSFVILLPPRPPIISFFSSFLQPVATAAKLLLFLPSPPLYLHPPSPPFPSSHPPPTPSSPTCPPPLTSSHRRRPPPIPSSPTLVTLLPPSSCSLSLPLQNSSSSSTPHPH